jgi:hypothetical protein
MQNELLKPTDEKILTYPLPCLCVLPCGKKEKNLPLPDSALPQLVINFENVSESVYKATFEL